MLPPAYRGDGSDFFKIDEWLLIFKLASAGKRWTPKTAVVILYRHLAGPAKKKMKKLYKLRNNANIPGSYELEVWYMLLDSEYRNLEPNYSSDNIGPAKILIDKINHTIKSSRQNSPPKTDNLSNGNIKDYNLNQHPDIYTKPEKLKKINSPQHKLGKVFGGKCSKNQINNSAEIKNKSTHNSNIFSFNERSPEMYNDYEEYQNYSSSTSSFEYDYSTFKFFGNKNATSNTNTKHEYTSAKEFKSTESKKEGNAQYVFIPSVSVLENDPKILNKLDSKILPKTLNTAPLSLGNTEVKTAKPTNSKKSAFLPTVSVSANETISKIPLNLKSTSKISEIKQNPINLTEKKAPSFNSTKNTTAFPVSKIQSFGIMPCLVKESDKSTMPINEPQKDKCLTNRKKIVNKNDSDLATDKKNLKDIKDLKSSNSLNSAKPITKHDVYNKISKSRTITTGNTQGKNSIAPTNPAGIKVSTTKTTPTPSNKNDDKKDSMSILSKISNSAKVAENDSLVKNPETDSVNNTPITDSIYKYIVNSIVRQKAEESGILFTDSFDSEEDEVVETGVYFDALSNSFFRYETDSDIEGKSGLLQPRKKYIDLKSDLKLISDINMPSAISGAAVETGPNSNDADTSTIPKKSKKKKNKKKKKKSKASENNSEGQSTANLYSSPSLETSKSVNNDKVSNEKVYVEAKPTAPKKNNSGFRINEGMLKALRY
ncbi:hypothetical protein AYI70_g4897 [Smittium culicis]|uniref:Uncharacterized protein n=1 Tax=Smittium culicis TaxID=133412 RepID=A0A1R1XX81_9FUNG|nr:hypothetical protein AYI70_g4897 [Smittium culicis]